MRQAKIYNHGKFAGMLTESDNNTFVFEYDDTYCENPISLTMPVSQKRFVFEKFPPFFDGVLPEGVMLEALLKSAKLDTYDYFGQLVRVGKDLVGSVTVEGVE